MKKIFVTGSTGYIGQLLVNRLLENGNTVHALMRDIEKNPFKHPNLKPVQGDILNFESVLKGMQGCLFVYHVAAYARLRAENSDTYYQVNLIGTKNILDASHLVQVEKIVVTSTGGVLGPSYDSPLEETWSRKLPFFNHYEKSKYLMEKMIKKYAARNLKVVIVNPPRVYGPGVMSQSNAVTNIIWKYMEGKWRIIPGNGQNLSSYAFVDDVVEGHILAMKNGASGERYILGGENISYNYLLNLIRELSGIRKLMFKVPMSLIIFFSLFESAIAKAGKWLPKLPYDWIRKYSYNWALSSQKAVDEIGYQITPFKKGLAKTIEWIEQNQKNFYKTVLITGASSGIGKSLASTFAGMKMNLVLVSLTETGLFEIGNQLKDQHKVNVNCFEVDLTTSEGPGDLYTWFKKNNLKINILINNAGVGYLGEFSNANMKIDEKLMQLNMLSVVKLIRLFLPELKKQTKSIIMNVGSLAGMFAVPYKTIYAASKSFILSFSRALREELKPYGIKVSCLCPGGTITSKEVIKRIEQGGALQRMFSMTADKLAILSIKDIMKGKAIIIPAWYNKFFVLISKLIPNSVLPVLFGKVFNS